MKIHHQLFLALALLACGSSYGAITVTTITDFTELYNEESVEGISLNKTNASLNNGDLTLQNGSLGFNMKSATNKPTIASQGFSIAMTFAAGSLSNPATLFSTTYYNASTGASQTGPFNGLFGAEYKNGTIHLGYWGATQTNASFTIKSIDVTSATGNISVVWSQSTSKVVSLSVYDGATLLGSMTSTPNLTFGSTNIDILSIGGKGTTDPDNLTNSYAAASDLELMGLQTMVGGTMDDSAFLDYYAQVVPEPATATLGLLGLAGLLVRRRRV